MKCPKCNIDMIDTHLMWIEQCPKCDLCFDVFHDKEVEYAWVYGDGYPDDEDEEDYEDYTDRTCPECNGSGGDRWNDGVVPCKLCQGAGYID